MRLPWGAATFTRPWYHAAPTPATATPATAAATGPGPGQARRPAAKPRRSLSPKEASRAPPAAAIFAEALRSGARAASHGVPKTRAWQLCRETEAVSAPPPSLRTLLWAGTGRGVPGGVSEVDWARLRGKDTVRRA